MAVYTCMAFTDGVTICMCYCTVLVNPGILAECPCLFIMHALHVHVDIGSIQVYVYISMCWMSVFLHPLSYKIKRFLFSDVCNEAFPVSCCILMY